MMRKDASMAENKLGSEEMCSITFPAMGFGAEIQMPKSSHLLSVLMSWPPPVDAEEHRCPVGSVSSLAPWWTCFGHSGVSK